MIYRSYRSSVPVLIVLLLGSLSAPDLLAQNAQRVGVVNVTRVFKAYKRVDDIQTLLRATFEPRQTALEKQRQQLVDMKTALENRMQAAPLETDKSTFNMAQEFKAAEWDLQMKARDLKQDYIKREFELMKEVLSEIKMAIQEIGATDGFDIVLRAPEFEDVFSMRDSPDETDEEKARKPRTASQMVEIFRENPVLFLRPGIDITDKVIAKLNAGNNAAGGAGSKPKPSEAPPMPKP